MNRIHVNDTMTADELKLRMCNSKDIQEHNRWQALYMAKAKGLSAQEIADIIGVSKYTVNKCLPLLICLLISIFTSSPLRL